MFGAVERRNVGADSVGASARRTMVEKTRRLEKKSLSLKISILSSIGEALTRVWENGKRLKKN